MDNKIMVYALGVVSCSVCAPKDMPVETVTAQLNQMQPTGISSAWRLSEDATFKKGEPMPCVCEEDPARLHYLFNC